jgi:F-type H+-transporting ATPase subunit delta
MKITPKQYATALYDAVKDKNKEAAGKAVAGFVRVIRENRDFGKMELIIEKFSEAWNEREEIAEFDIISAKEMSKKSIDELKREIKEGSGVRSVELSRSVDKDLLGGFILRGKDKTIDASVRTKLKMLKEKMIR